MRRSTMVPKPRSNPGPPGVAGVVNSPSTASGPPSASWPVTVPVPAASVSASSVSVVRMLWAAARISDSSGSVSSG